MQRSEIHVGDEVAFIIPGHSFGIHVKHGMPNYGGRLGHGKVISTTAPFEKRIPQRFSSQPRTATRFGFLIELVEDFGKDGEAPSARAGERFTIESGKEIVRPWEDYSAALLEHRSAQAQKEEQAERAARRFEAISTEMASRGLEVLAVRAPRWIHDDSSRDPQGGVELTLDAIETLLFGSPMSLRPRPGETPEQTIERVTEAARAS